MKYTSCKIGESIRYIILIFTFSYVFTVIGHAQTIFPDESGAVLLSNLRSDYYPNSVLSLAHAKDTIYSSIDNMNDFVHAIYCDHSIFLPDDVDPSVWLYAGRDEEAINIEHVYPRSKGAFEGTFGYSDMHHLYPSRAHVNSDRSSFPFGEINDDDTNVWYLFLDELSSPPATDRDLYSEFGLGKFEPRESRKGDIARAIFYFFTMYESSALATDPNFFESMKVTLCQWHHDDAIADSEITRSNLIASHQGNENPFVLDCTLASRSYCMDMNLSCNSIICSIDSVTAVQGVCNDDQLFDVIIDFQYQEVSDSFEIAGNGNNYGMFAYSDVPVTIEGLSGDCMTPYEFVVRDKSNAICQNFTELGIVCCDPVSTCSIFDLSILDIECRDNGNYDLIVDFNYTDPENDFYDIWINNQFTGFFALADLPQRFENITERANSDYDIVRVCINDNPECCQELEYMAPDCSMDTCVISDLLIEATDCNDDGLFDVLVSFNHSFTSDSFEIRGNGINYGRFSYGQEPITISNLMGDCTLSYEFIIIDGVNPDCLEDVGLGVVCCDTISTCAIRDLSVTDIECRDNGNYDLIIDFNYTDPGNDTYDIWINNQFAGFFALADLPQRFENITERVNSDYDIVRICINDNPDCCQEIEFMAPDCSMDTCLISDLSVEVTDCNDDGLFDALISFNHSFTSDSFEVHGNGINYGRFSYEQEPITISNLQGDCILAYEFVIIDSQNSMCVDDIDLGIICCDSTPICSIDGLSLAETECRANGNYDLIINFNYTDPANDFYDIWINNQFAGFFALADLPQRFENITERANSDYDIVRVCINDNPDCCQEIEYMAPDCVVIGTDDIVENEFQIFAYSGLISIIREVNSGGEYKIVVYDPLGRIHDESSTTQRSHSIYVENWVPGIYIVHVFGGLKSDSKVIWISE